MIRVKSETKNLCAIFPKKLRMPRPSETSKVSDELFSEPHYYEIDEEKKEEVKEKEELKF
jgi:hypothetical protein